MAQTLLYLGLKRNGEMEQYLVTDNGIWKVKDERIVKAAIDSGKSWRVIKAVCMLDALYQLVEELGRAKTEIIEIPQEDIHVPAD